MELAHIFTQNLKSFLRDLNVVEDVLRISSVLLFKVTAYESRDNFDVVDIDEVEPKVQCAW